MGARAIIEAVQIDDAKSRAREIIRLARSNPGFSKSNHHSAHEVIMHARNDEALARLLGDEEEDQDAVEAEITRQLAAGEDRTFKTKATKFKKAATADDPVAHLRLLAQGKTWPEFKRVVFGSALGGHMSLDQDDESAEAAFKQIYNASQGANYAITAQRSAEVSWRLSGAMLTAKPRTEYEMGQNGILRQYFPRGVPEQVTVYRGVPRPDVKTRPGDYCTLDREVARAYVRGPHGVILTEKLPAKDLVVDKATVGATELIYWPEGSKPVERGEPPVTLRQLWAEANS